MDTFNNPQLRNNASVDMKGMSAEYRLALTFVILLFSAAVLSLTSGQISAQEPPTFVPDHENTIQIIVGTQKQWQVNGRVQRVAVGNPEVADVSVLNRRDVLITGKSKGITSLMIWKVGVQKPEEYRLAVGEAYDPALAVLDRQAVVNTQVQTDIKVVEVRRSALRQFGFNWFKNGQGGKGAISRPGTFSGFEGNGAGGVTFNSPTGFLPISDAFNILYGDSSAEHFVTLSLLERQGLARVLAEPSLVAMSGQTATFLAGGEFPIPVQQGGSGGSGGITIEFKEFGVRLTLTPTVLGNERIVLKVAPEVSELDFNASVNAGGVAVPALTVRRTETTVELGSGETFIISGLVSQNTLANVDKVPYLSKVPILGAFFRSTRFDRENKELVMLVQPHLVKPIKKGADLPPLPGQEYEAYNPGAAQLIFKEEGEFGNTGFSR